MGCVRCVEIYLGHQIGQHHTALNGHDLLQTIQGEFRHLLVILRGAWGGLRSWLRPHPCCQDASPTHLPYLLTVQGQAQSHIRSCGTHSPAEPKFLPSCDLPCVLLSHTVKATLVGARETHSPAASAGTGECPPKPGGQWWSAAAQRFWLPPPGPPPGDHIVPSVPWAQGTQRNRAPTTSQAWACGRAPSSARFPVLDHSIDSDHETEVQKDREHLSSPGAPHRELVTKTSRNR